MAEQSGNHGQNQDRCGGSQPKSERLIVTQAYPVKAKPDYKTNQPK
jgi:hypothetical protein